MSVKKAYAAQTSDLGDRQIRVVCSTGIVDRAGEIVVQSGIDLTAYKANPIVLWQHDPEKPIGKAISISQTADGLTADIEFAPAGISAKADEVYGLVKAGVINSVSIGFDPIDSEPMDKARPKGPEKYLAIELLEMSMVSIPANPEAAVVQRRHKSNDPKWVMGAADDLEIVSVENWDGRDAATRILDDAGIGDDKPEPDRAKLGFLAYDSGNATLRGAYKLPFADIVDGKLKAVDAGIRAAASRLDQADIPDDVAKAAQAIIDSYEEKMKQNEAKTIPARRTKVATSGSALVVKDLYDVGQLAYLLNQLGWAQYSARVETALEGDASKLPDMLIDAMHSVGAALIAMTAEEVAEAITEAGGTLGQDDDMSDLPDDDVQIILTSKVPAVRRYKSGFFRAKYSAAKAKAGKVLSAATCDVLKDMIAQHENAMDMHRKALAMHTKAMKMAQDLVDDTETETQSTGVTGEGGTTSEKSRAQRVKEAEALRVN